ncbi:hypothetical protein DIPPA_16753 [Diplonema papillatum]|nr:hypothetical protein DIPPA_16753 [Diplonema papillatum]
MNRAITLEEQLPHVGSQFSVQSRQGSDRMIQMSTIEKALTMNLDATKYGVFCEIGAGQEVVRHFFLAGGASGTIAKSMSAYDKDVSDAIYGQETNKRYVTRGRLEKMLSREYDLLVDRMPQSRASKTQYFVFADTVAAMSYSGKGECHGWLGVRAQLYPNAEPSQILIHVRMLDSLNKQQAEALGILGVNLLYSTFYLKRQPLKILEALLDNVGRERLEIDQCHLSGAYFDVDPRLIALHLITKGLTHAVLFDADGNVANVGDVLYRKDVLVLRGKFRPITRVAADMKMAAAEMLKAEEGVTERSIITLAEISNRQLTTTGDNKEVDHHDFLSRVDAVCSLGISVIVSDYLRFFRLREYLGRYTRRKVRFCMSVFNVIDLFQESFYQGMPGGVLEAMGRLFSDDVRLYIYPRVDPENPSKLITADGLFLEGPQQKSLSHLYSFLRLRGKVVPVEGYDQSVLQIDTSSVIVDLQRGGEQWEKVVPPEVVKTIKQNQLFGYNKL